MTANRSRPRRLALDIDAATYEWLQVARVKDHLTTSDRIRALIDLWQLLWSVHWLATAPERVRHQIARLLAKP